MITYIPNQNTLHAAFGFKSLDEMHNWFDKTATQIKDKKNFDNLLYDEKILIIMKLMEILEETSNDKLTRLFFGAIPFEEMEMVKRMDRAATILYYADMDDVFFRILRAMTPVIMLEEK